MLIWDYQDSIWACISKRKDKETSFNIACFKNARVMEEEAMRGIHAEYYDLLIDYMGFKAEKILQVHRNRFNSDFSCAQYYSEIFSAYYQFCKRISAEEKAFAEGKTGTGISILVSRRDECLVEMLHMDAIHEDSFEFMGNENDSDKYSIVKRWGDFPDFTDEKIESKTVLKDMEAVLLKSDGVIVAVCEEADDSDDTSGFDRVKQKTTDEVTVLKRAKIEQWKAGPESGESADDGMETYDCIVKKGYAIKEKTVVKILLSCRSLEKKYVQIEGADFKLVILSHSKEPEKMDEDTFYACSYQGFPNGWIDAAESVDGYSALYVDMIPYQTGQESRLPGGYLLSPVRKTARNALDKLYDLPRIDNKTGKRGRQKVSRKAFTNCIIQQEEYKALLDWVYKHQLKRGDEQLVGRDEIRKAYDRYIRKIYDWKEKNAELERVGHS